MAVLGDAGSAEGQRKGADPSVVRDVQISPPLLALHRRWLRSPNADELRCYQAARAYQCLALGVAVDG